MSSSNTKTLSSQAKAFRRRKRIILISSLSALVLVGGGMTFAKKVLWPKFKAHQIQEINRDAAELLNQKDPVNAMLLVRKSLQKSQENPEAWRLGAAAAKARSLPEAIYYQNQLCKAEPTKENRMEMLRIANFFEQYGLVLSTGKDVAKDAARDPEYHEIMAATYKKIGRPIAAKYHLEILCSLRPNDNTALLNLAAFELENDKERKDKNLRARIRSFADQPALRKQALTMLLREAVDNRLKVDSLELLSRLEVTNGLELPERLLLIEATRLCRPNLLEEQILRLQAEYASNPVDVTRIMDFLRKLEESARVKPWFDKLSAELQNNEEVRRACADALFTLQDWKNLIALLQPIHWEHREYLRLALLSYSYKASGLITEYFENWKAATMQAGVDPKMCLDLLLRLETWRWDAERYDVIWKLFYIFPENEQLRNQLYAWELKNKNTPNLNRMFMRMLEINPDDATTQSNFAYSSFLLNANLGRAGLLAQNLYTLNPNEPYFVTLYAFALLKQGKETEAKKLMESLRQSALSQPERLAIYSFILSKTGDYERATEVIAGIARNTLLPEEKGLIERAEDEIARGSRTREIVSRVTAMRENAANTITEGGWLPMLQPETRSAATPAMQLTNTLYSSGDLKGMSEILRDDDWHELEYLRNALSSYAHRQLGRLVQASDLWRVALSAAKRNQVALENLQNLSSRWDWQPERIQVLNALFEVTPNNRVLLSELLELYRSKKKTAEMTRLLDTYLTDKNLKGDEAVAYAYYCLISGINTSQATVRAKECYEAEPDNTEARYVMAFALSRQNRDAEAARLLAETKGSTSEIVSIPLIQACVALGTDNTDGATKALSEIDKSKALAEELLIVEKLSVALRAKKTSGK